MSVFQVEEYYLHLDIKGASEKVRKDIDKYLSDNDFDRYVIETDYVVVDGLEEERYGENLERELLKLIV